MPAWQGSWLSASLTPGVLPFSCKAAQRQLPAQRLPSLQPPLPELPGPGASVPLLSDVVNQAGARGLQVPAPRMIGLSLKVESNDMAIEIKGWVMDPFRPGLDAV